MNDSGAASARGRILAWVRQGADAPESGLRGRESGFRVLLLTGFLLQILCLAVIGPVFAAHNSANTVICLALVAVDLLAFREVGQGRSRVAAWIFLWKFWILAELISFFSGGVRSPMQGMVFVA